MLLAHVVPTSPAPKSAPTSDNGRGSRLRLLVLVPAYNEAANVGAVVDGVRRSLPDADVLVIDDGSSDRTAQVACAAGASVLRLPVNLGYGAALQSGYKHAVRRGYDIVAQLDADGQHRPEFLGKLLDLLHSSGSDVMIGSRFLDRDGHYSPSRARKMGMAVFGRIASAVTRQHVSDPTSGFQVMRREVAEFFCSDIYPTDYPDADILILLHRSGFKVAEVGVEMRPPAGRSMHSGHRSVYYVYKMSLSIVMTLLRTGIRSSR